MIDLAAVDALAQAAHQGQLRKDSNLPYIAHPRRVAQIVRAHGGRPALQAAALLHDTLEDTSADVSTIRAAFGDEVADLVLELTDAPEWGSLQRGPRKAAQALKMTKASKNAQMIKLADTLANLEDLEATASHWSARAFRRYAETTLVVIDACAPAAPGLAKEIRDKARALAEAALPKDPSPEA